jgi:hypothetical protein
MVTASPLTILTPAVSVAVGKVLQCSKQLEIEYDPDDVKLSGSFYFGIMLA